MKASATIIAIASILLFMGCKTTKQSDTATLDFGYGYRVVNVDGNDVENSGETEAVFLSPGMHEVKFGYSSEKPRDPYMPQEFTVTNNFESGKEYWVCIIGDSAYDMDDPIGPSFYVAELQK